MTGEPVVAAGTSFPCLAAFWSSVAGVIVLFEFVNPTNV
jgi:hypothetical protein